MKQLLGSRIAPRHTRPGSMRGWFLGRPPIHHHGHHLLHVRLQETASCSIDELTDEAFRTQLRRSRARRATDLANSTYCDPWTCSAICAGTRRVGLARRGRLNKAAPLPMRAITPPLLLSNNPVLYPPLGPAPSKILKNSTGIRLGACGHGTMAPTSDCVQRQLVWIMELSTPLR